MIQQTSSYTKYSLPEFSVIMPTYNQSVFIRRALFSLLEQTYQHWELIIIDDGSDDNTGMYIQDFISDPRITYLRNPKNRGLGNALNQGLELAKYGHIAYLPADDYFYTDHLESLAKTFSENKNTCIVFSGMEFDNTDSLTGQQTVKTDTNYIRKGYSLQLVQTSHKKTAMRWMEREECITEDLYLMFWHKLTGEGIFTPTGKVTCTWGSHYNQHHKIAGEKFGGCVNRYRTYYKVESPLRVRLSAYKLVDEEKLYAPFRNRTLSGKKKLKILLVGSLAYNPERIYALEEYGHLLYGLWIPNPTYSFSNVGPVPFGHITDIPYDEHWVDTVKKIKPDIIYGLTNWDGVNFIYDVVKKNPGIPFVFHFKESPYLCIKNGLWDKLFHLYAAADGRIFLSHIIRSWYEQFILPTDRSFIMDLDPPKKDYFTHDFSPKLSAKDGAIHTVVAGRMIGIDKEMIRQLARHNIHLHLYLEGGHEQVKTKNKKLKEIAPGHFHIHPHVFNTEWVKEFSQYDAGWLHCFESKNGGDIRKATWDDLNIPARIYTLAAAGLPSIQKNNVGHLVAMQAMAKKTGSGIFFNDIPHLAEMLHNRTWMSNLQNNILHERDHFTFDYYVPQLTDFFLQIINDKKNGQK